MATVIMDVSMSLDGFSAGPNVRQAEPMGDGGERLHDWIMETRSGPDAEADIEARRNLDAALGAVLIGRRTFDLGLEPWGGTPWPGIPSFVVTHRPQPDLLGGNGGTFAFDSLESAVTRAKEAAGDKDVFVMGADLGRHVLRAGLLDALWIHLVPILMGDGTRLFDGERADLILDGTPTSGRVTHLRFRVARPGV